MGFFTLVIAVLAGSANPLQGVTNAQLNRQLQQPVWAGISVYASGLLGMLLVQAIVRQPVPTATVSSVNWWAWTGGLISIGSTMAGLLLVHRLGAGVFTGLSVTAALVVSVLMDQFGVLGLKQHTASPGRVAGCVLLVVGVWLVSRF